MRLRFPLLLDGPIGTELARRGVRLDPHLWSSRALIEHPDLVREIHRDYIAAGADIVTTNSFRTNPRAVNRSEYAGRAEHLTRRSVELAREAALEFPEREILIAGSIAPVDDCYAPDLTPRRAELYSEHLQHIDNLLRAGADLLLLETMNTVAEASAASEAAATREIPFMVSVVTDRTGRKMLSGEPLEECVAELARFRPTAILTNCASPHATLEATRILAHTKAEAGAVWEFGAYPNEGEPDPVLGYERVRPVPLREFVDIAETMLRLGAGVIGGCCGTTPEHTAALAGLFLRAREASVP